MVIDLVVQAVQIKIRAKMESPLISVYEFCNAAGLGLKALGASEEQMRELADGTFADFKMQVQALVKESGAFAGDPDRERLKSLIAGCRVRGEFSGEARQLLEMGYHEGRTAQ